MKKNLLFPLLAILAATLLLAVLPTEADAAIYTDTTVQRSTERSPPEKLISPLPFTHRR